MRAKFIKNDFDGLLPGEFTEAGTNWDRPGTSVIPEGMNDENKEDMGKYVALSTCDYLIDSYFPPSPGSEPSDTASQSNYILDTTAWEKVSCEKFLDSGKTPTLARTFWVPEVVLPAGMKRQWGEYCLLRRRDRGATIASGGKARGNVEDVG